MRRAGCLVLIFIGLLAYFNAIRHPFVHDDIVFILKDPRIADLNHWYNAFQMTSSADGINTYYRPVLEVLYRFEYRLFGFNPYGFHLFNIIVHLVNGVLVFLILQKLGLSEAISWIVSCLFLIHPVQTEAVCCIAGISNLWMALGVLSALLAFINRRYAISMLFFIMAFLSKEQAVMFVPLAFIAHYTQENKVPGTFLKENDKKSARHFFNEWVLLGTVTGLLFVLRHELTGASLVRDIMVSPGELFLRIMAIPRDLGMYLRLIFWPFDLHYYRSTDILQSNVLALQGFFIAVIALLYISFRWHRTRPIWILGWGWFFAALLPVLNIAPLINEYSFILTAEHFLYLPIVGILVMVVVAVDRWLKHFRKLILGLVIASCLLLTWHQNTFWKSEVVLFERMLQFEPDFGRGQLLLARAYYFSGRPQDADKHYARALDIMSSYARRAANMTSKKFYIGFIKEILYDWAENDSAMKRWDPALEKYQAALRLDRRDPSIYNNIAFVYLQMGDRKKAYISLQNALSIDPSFAIARRNLQGLRNLIYSNK